MVRKQFGQPMIVAEAKIHEPLHQVHVRTAVALDHDWTVVRDGNVPAVQHAVRTSRVSLDGELSPALAPARVPVAAIDSPTDFDFWMPGVGDPIELTLRVEGTANVKLLPRPPLSLAWATAVPGD